MRESMVEWGIWFIFSPPSLPPSVSAFARGCLLQTFQGRNDIVAGPRQKLEGGKTALGGDLAHFSDFELREGGREGGRAGEWQVIRY